MGESNGFLFTGTPDPELTAAEEATEFVAPEDEGEDADPCDVPAELVELHQLLELAADPNVLGEGEG